MQTQEREASPAHAPATALAERLPRDGAGVITDQELDERGNLLHSGKFLDAGGFEHNLGGDVFFAHLVQLGLLLDLSAHERRVDEARADAVHSDAMGCCLKGHDLRQAQHSVLRCHVAATPCY